MKRTTWTKWFSVLAAGGALTMAEVRSAEACGCFTPPDPAVPVVQAGERIAFAIDSGQVTAHIQIQYAGAAGDFGWLLPLPSLPKLELGNDEVFNQLIATTQPKYEMTKVFNGNCQFNNRLNGLSGAAPNAPGTGKGVDDQSQPSPLVIQSSVGPYTYAVLKADSKQAMLDWLAQNHYFVPVGTDDVVAPYVHPGAFFLALKLRPGNASGDLQPVVVHYASDLPMIPIVLSSVAAQKNMGIQVWMLGAARAIPRNYYHTVINDAEIDWLTAGQNYNDVIIRAAGESPKHHTFVTEYAGSSSVMKNLLNAPGRFGNADELRAQHDPGLFASYMSQHGFPFDAQVVAILQKYIPFPSGISAMGVTAPQYYQQLGYWLGQYRKQNPQAFAGYDFTFDPAPVTDDLESRVVMPTLAAGALFDQFPYLTRLYTTLSPEDMNADPVFSFNPDLPAVSNIHQGTLTYECGAYGSGDQNSTYAWLQTPDGARVIYPNGTGTPPPLAAMPASRRIEILREAGAPVVVVDNSDAIAHALSNGGGCSVNFGGSPNGAGLALLFGLVALAFGLRRRASNRA